MNHSQSNLSKCARALLVVALLGAGSHALADAAPAPAPAPIDVVIIDETDKGYDRAILYKRGIASRASAFNKGPHADALYKALGDENVRVRLAAPTGCPTQGTLEPCANVRRIKDVELPAAIAAAKGGTLLILWPEAAYFKGEQLFLAYLDVDVIQKGKVVPGTFYVGYRDWECDEHCVPTAFEASAKELSAMVRYMLELGPVAQSKAVPAPWLSKPLVTSVDKWANSCATKLNKDRVVREYGERFWLNDPSSRTLTSGDWGGCNIFAARI
jgi:hypothetical protein